MLKILILITALTGSLLAEDKSPRTDPEHWADYYQASADVAAIRASLEAATAKLNAAARALMAECAAGNTDKEHYEPGLDESGKRGCLKKPVTSK